MTIPHPLTLTAASLVLAFAASVALAQTAPTRPATAKPAAKPVGKTAAKTLGGGTAGAGKLMTRDELRSCMKRLDELNTSGKEIEAQRPLLDSERAELQKSGEALRAERAELDRRLAAVREWEGKLRVHSADVEAFNKRSAAMSELPRGQQDKLAEELKIERERLERSRGALSAEEAQLVPAYQTKATAHSERALARDAKVTAWNARNVAAVDASVKQEEARALWLSDCANRPYLEDDEKALKAGK